jgi:hypothetical protein
VLLLIQERRGLAESYLRDLRTTALYNYAPVMADSSANALVLETSELLLNRWLRKYEAKYLPDVTPSVVQLNLSAPDKGPACYLKTDNTILVHPSLGPFMKISRVLILHELIHSKLFKENGDPDEGEGERFQSERARLWEEGAYADLL